VWNPSAAVRRAINQLPDGQWEAIILCQYHGFSYQEISEIMDCSLTSVKALIYRGKERLRTELLAFIKEQSR
jgi:RNA polymerase sigma-70 factor (ECF subfamily)